MSDTVDTEPPESVTCHGCSTAIEEGEPTLEFRGDTYCTYCLTECDHCACSIETDDANRAHGGEVLCDDCAWTCDDCSRTYSPDHSSICTANGDTVCERCYHDNYFTCDACCEVYSCDDATSNNNGTYCADCAPNNREEDEEDSVIQSYHSTRDVVRCLPSPFSRQHNGRFFGVELEVEVKEGEREEVAARIDGFVNGQSRDITAESHAEKVLYFEQDGSLTNGFEMVSAPLGLDDQSRLWKTALSANLTKGLRSHDTETCGLHVHVSRAGLSDVQISKAVCFVNDPDNRPLIETLARRYGTGYCKVGKKKLTTAHHSDGDRYQAVNLCNRHTVEFRIFRGTLRYSSVMAAIEFSNAVIQFATPANGVGYNLKTPAFIEFINTAPMRKHTAYLRLYLAEKMRGATFPAGFKPTNL